MYDFYALTEKGLKHQKNSDYFFINDYISQDSSYKTTSKKNKLIFGVADGVGVCKHPQKLDNLNRNNSDKINQEKICEKVNSRRNRSLRY